MTLPTVSGWLVISRLGLATINQQTKFEVSNYSHYKDMKSGAICRNWGSLGQLGVTQGHRQCHHSIQRIRLPTQLNWNCASILYHFSRYSQFICRKSPILTHPTCIWCPSRVDRDWKLNSAKIFGTRKLVSLGYRVVFCGTVIVILRLILLAKHRLVTDRQTDRQTQGHSSYHTSIKSHDKTNHEAVYQSSPFSTVSRATYRTQIINFYHASSDRTVYATAPRLSV